jgi:hypothetical protein
MGIVTSLSFLKNGWWAQHLQGHVVEICKCMGQREANSCPLPLQLGFCLIIFAGLKETKFKSKRTGVSAPH